MLSQANKQAKSLSLSLSLSLSPAVSLADSLLVLVAEGKEKPTQVVFAMIGTFIPMNYILQGKQ